MALQARNAATAPSPLSPCGEVVERLEDARDRARRTNGSVATMSRRWPGRSRQERGDEAGKVDRLEGGARALADLARCPTARRRRGEPGRSLDGAESLEEPLSAEPALRDPGRRHLRVSISAAAQARTRCGRDQRRNARRAPGAISATPRARPLASRELQCRRDFGLSRSNRAFYRVTKGRRSAVGREGAARSVGRATP